MENNREGTINNGYNKCIFCGEPFTDANVFTELGWKETKISGMCEKCWDKTFADCEE